MAKEDVEVIIRIKVSSEVAAWLENLKASRERCNVTSRAITLHHEYLFYPRGFFIRLVQCHFEEIKHVLRKIGASRKLCKS